MTWEGSYTDIILCVIMLIAFIVGLKKGFIKQLSALIGGLFAFGGAIALTIFISAQLKETEFFLTFVNNTTTGWFSSEFFSSDMVLKVAETLNGGALEVSIEVFLGTLAAIAICDFVVWLVLYIALKFLIKGIKALLLKIVHLPVLSTIDRVFGAIWALLMTYCVLIVIVLTAAEIVIIKFVPDFWEPVKAIISDSRILSFAHESNIIGQLIAQKLEIVLPSIGN